MQLTLLTPTQILLDTPVDKIDVEAIDGFFTLLPRHIDFITSLRSSILSYTIQNKTYYAACDHGVLVKKGADVHISTALAILNDNLENLKKVINVKFKEMEQERKELNISMARLELGLTKGLMNLSKGTEYANL